MDIEVYAEMAALEENHWWFSGRRAILRAVLRRHLGGRRGLRVLEVGPGTGGNLKMLGEFGRLWALEPHGEALRLCAAKRVGTSLVEGWVPETELGMRFDLICLFDVLEHIADERAAVRWVDDHLEPRGRVLLAVPAFPFLWSGHDVSHHHRRRYTRRRLLAVCGLWRALHVSYFNTLLFPPIAAFRLGKRLFERATGAPARSDARPCPKGINALLRNVFAWERHLVPRWRLPFGASLLGLFEKAP